MKLAEGLLGLLSFFTSIPVKGDSERVLQAAEYMPLSPLIGLILGFSAGLFAWVILHILPPLLVGVMTLGVLLLLTGLHHTDGLLDFGDGLMCQGTPERKIEAMRDEHTGVGGVSLLSITLVTTAFAITHLRVEMIIQGLMVAEASAKASMALAVWIGRSPSEGLGTPFIEAMHRGGRTMRLMRLVVSLAIPFSAGVLLLQASGVASPAAGLLTSLFLVWTANKHFRGVTGDVCGAVNDLSRMASLIPLVTSAP